MATMTTTTIPVHPLDRLLDVQDPPTRPAVAEWLLAMGPVVHRLDYGGRVAAVGSGDPTATTLLAAAYPLATVDAVGPEAMWALPARSHDLVCLLDGLADADDPVARARAALAAVRRDGAVMVVGHGRTDAFDTGPIAVGTWLLAAGAARVRLASATPHGFVLDARPDH